MGFIEDMTEHILRHIPTQPQWAETVSIATLSTVLDGIRYATTLGPLQLNIFALCIGPSGLANKTLPMKNVARPIIKRLQELTDWRFFLPSKFSVEGLIEYMSNYSSIGIIMSDEFTQVVKNYYGKDYQADLMEFMSELYDGQPQERFTRKTKLESAPRVFVSMISATTPYLYHVLRPDIFLQGTANRFVFVLFKEPNYKRYTSDEFFVAPERTRDMDQINSELAEGLADLRKTILRGGWTIGVSPEAGDVLLNYRDTVFKRSAELWAKSRPNDFEYSYLIRMPEIAFKIAGIKTMGDAYRILPRSNLREIIMSKEQAEWTIGRMCAYEVQFNNLLRDWYEYNVEPIEVKSLEKYVSLVKRVIAGNGGSIPRGELLSRTRISAKDLTETLTSAQDEIVATVEKTSGRERVVYRLNVS